MVAWQGVRDDLTSPQALLCIHKSQGRQRRMGNLLTECLCWKKDGEETQWLLELQFGVETQVRQTVQLRPVSSCWIHAQEKWVYRKYNECAFCMKSRVVCVLTSMILDDSLKFLKKSIKLFNYLINYISSLISISWNLLFVAYTSTPLLRLCRILFLISISEYFIRKVRIAWHIINYLLVNYKSAQLRSQTHKLELVLPLFTEYIWYYFKTFTRNSRSPFFWNQSILAFMHGSSTQTKYRAGNVFNINLFSGRINQISFPSMCCNWLMWHCTKAEYEAIRSYSVHLPICLRWTIE